MNNLNLRKNLIFVLSVITMCAVLSSCTYSFNYKKKSSNDFAHNEQNANIPSENSGETPNSREHICDYIGLTMKEATDDFGEDYFITDWEGAVALVYEEPGFVFLFEDAVDTLSSDDRISIVCLTKRGIPAVANIKSGRSFTELEKDTNISLEKPVKYYNAMDEEWGYSTEFEYNGYYIYCYWNMDPMKFPCSEMRISLKKQDIENNQPVKKPAVKEPAKAVESEQPSKKSYFRNRASEIESYSANNLDNAEGQINLNVEANNVYKKWDDLLNEVYRHLKATMPSGEFENLKRDEAEWIKNKESAMENSANEFAGGSAETFGRYSAGIDWTRERCYYLISLVK